MKGWRQLSVIVLCGIIGSTSGHAQGSNTGTAFASLSAYSKSELWFNSLSDQQRKEIQSSLSLTGDFTAILDGEFGTSTFEALESFQRDAGFPADGVLTETQQHVLHARFAEQANRLNFRPFYDDRARFTVSLPLAYLDAPMPEDGGSQWKSKDGRLTILTTRSAKTDGTMAASYLDVLSGELFKGVKFSTFRPGFFIVSGLIGQMRFYIKVQEDRDTAVGFFAFWRNGDDGDIRRLVVAISNSIQTLQVDKATASNAPEGVAPIEEVEQRPLPPLPENHPLPALADKPIVTGTGFFVSSSGYLMTNAHVVENCQEAAIRFADGRWSRTSIVARNEVSDLAILKSEISAPAVATFRGSPPLKLGTEIVLFGYPRIDLLTSTGNLVNGLVSGLAGPNDYAGMIQISAPVQKGNSGGAVLDKSGNVVGIVFLKLNGDAQEVLQDANFAIHADLARSFLTAEKIPFETVPSNDDRQITDLADRAKSFSALVTCQPQ